MIVEIKFTIKHWPECPLCLKNLIDRGIVTVVPIDQCTWTHDTGSNVYLSADQLNALRFMMKKAKKVKITPNLTKYEYE